MCRFVPNGELPKGWEIAAPFYLYRIMPVSISKSVEGLRQGVHARIKYAPETACHYREPQDDDARTGWYEIAALEFSDGESEALSGAAEFLGRELPGTARGTCLLSCSAGMAASCISGGIPG